MKIFKLFLFFRNKYKLQSVACICFRLSLPSILKVPYLLHKDPMTLLAPTNQPRIKYEKIQLNNSFWVNTRWRWTIIQSESKILPLKKQGICSRPLQCLYVLFYIFNLEYPKKLESTFLLIQKLFLRISDKCKVLSEV